MLEESPPNPYESPAIKTDHMATMSVGKILALVSLGLLTIPAAGIAFVATCLGTAVVFENGPNMDVIIVAALGLGLIAGTVTFGGGLYLVFRLGRRWVRSAQRQQL